MDIATINPFIVSTTETFSMMMGVNLDVGTPVGKSVYNGQFDISGIIGLSGDIEGVVALSFSTAVAQRAVSRLLGQECRDVDELLADGVGELANIVAGNAKQYFSQKEILITLPYVISGKGSRIICGKSVPVTVVPMQGLLGEFGMEIALRSR